MDAEKFFNKNSDFYGCLNPEKYDFFFIDFISRHSKACNLLDVGGGGGCFTKLCKERFETSSLTIVDPSESLLKKQELTNIKLVIGKLPNDLNVSDKYDYIHIKEVLHHVTGSSINECLNLFKTSLVNLKENNLNPSGYILMHELFYESYIFPTFTRTFIFYLLKLQNKLHIRIPAKEFIKGLDVCFYTREELRQIFKEMDFEVVDYYEEKWEHRKYLRKFVLLKEWGRMCFVVQRIG